MASRRVISVLSLLLCLMFMASDSTLYGASALSSMDETIPLILEVPKGNEAQQVLFATGAQMYTYNGTAWINNNVSADLYNFKGLKVGHHFFLGEKDVNGGQPSWETFHPYTRFTGKVVETVHQQNDSIPWVLLQATTNIGKKKFIGASTFIQRIYTHGGLAPCAEYPAEEGAVFKSNYTTLYQFWAAT
ncbi:unnamed protein product [Calypogeia fissa]